MKKVLAISGGVDSMVMLHLFLNDPEIVVAHFDHGTRSSSKSDAEFVENFCKQRGIKFYGEQGNLSGDVSEEKAREARYDFLRKVAFREKGEIYTAHHVDDMVESVAINCLRGTGHKGLAPMSALGVCRPLLEKGWTKKDVLKYAASNEIVFREDPTNTSDNYLRNRIRKAVRALNGDTKQEIFRLFCKQKELEREIDIILENIVPEDNKFERGWFYGLDDAVCMEILRHGLSKAGISATRPQIANFLDAIRTYRSGKKFNLPGDRLIRINKKDFEIY